MISHQRNFIHVWKIVEVQPYRKLSIAWKYQNYPGDSLVTFELFQEKGITKLRLTHEILESFPQDIAEFTRQSGVEGWKYFINKRFKDYLNSLL